MKLAFLQHAQQLRLRAGVQIAHFVQKECSVIGQFKLAAARRGGTRESSFFMTEEFAFNQLRGDSRAIHFDERTGGEGAQFMQVCGEEFFARAGFADQQHTRIGLCSHGGLGNSAFKRGAGTDHARTGADDLTQFLILLPECCLRERILNCHQDAFAAERLFEEVESAGAGCFDCIGNGGVARDHDHR